MAQFGSVLEWGSRGRKFESSHPDIEAIEKSLLFFVLLGEFSSIVVEIHAV